MQEKHVFEYAVIRVVPRVERGEYLNVGVILYCAAKNFLQAKFELEEPRLHALCKDLDLEELKDRLCAFDHICAGKLEGGRIGAMPLASRFRWLTATRSTIVQTSQTHPGLCTDMDKNLEHLFETLVK